VIIHLDADAFFASVEQAADPKLRGKPIAVGGDQRGIIASASYEARQLGIFTPMPTARARKLCPKLIVIPPDFEKYEQFSKLMFSYAYDFTPEVEISSIDEGYFDLSGSPKHSPRATAETIRHAILQNLKLSVSEGIATNKLVAQVASKLRKPASLIEVEPGNERLFLAPLPNHWLPGVGPKLSAILNNAGLATIEQISKTSAELLALLAGNYGAQLLTFSNGIDHRPVMPIPAEAKSYGEQATFAEDTTDEVFLLAKLHSITDRLATKVREDQKSFRTISLKIRYNDLGEVTRSASLAEPSNLEQDLYPLLPELLKKAWERRVSLRMISLRLTSIYPNLFPQELNLGTLNRKRQNEQRLSPILDQLRSQYSLMRGHDLWLKKSTKKIASPTIPITKAPPPFLSKISPKNFIPLNLKSYFSFLDSTLSIPALIKAATEMGAQAIAIADPNLHGAVAFFSAAHEAGIKPIIGAEIRNADRPFNLYVENTTGYANLCHLLSQPSISPSLLADHRSGLILAESTNVALPEIRYRSPKDREKFAILQSIRTLTLLNQPHPKKRIGNFHWPTNTEVAHHWSPQAIRTTHQIAERCEFTFEFGRLRLPRFTPPIGSNPRDFLKHLAFTGLKKRYGNHSNQHEIQLQEELKIISEVGYESYFLTTWEILQECRQRQIHWITRGSAADSLVCYCLEISGVCPIRFELYFQRFLNRERMALHKLPDIDLDFPHDRKDEVVDLIFNLYGPNHTAIVGGFNTYRERSAIADIAKVLGVSEWQIRRLTENLPQSHLTRGVESVSITKNSPGNLWKEEPYQTALQMASFLDGFPRHPKMHPCGIVLSRDPITTLTPTFFSAKGYPTTHFEMDAAEKVGLIKMDILAQGGLAVIRDCLQLLAKNGIHPQLENLAPWDNPHVWAMLASGNARGVHHIESPAMISLAQICHVQNIDCLIAIVSIIRPGAANGTKKKQFARRAQGLDPVEYPHPSLEPILRTTFGVVAYEEHILQICQAFAGLSGGRSDLLRRALAKKNLLTIAEIKKEFILSAQSLHRSPLEIERVWTLVEAFQGYAFCRAHSTAYALEAYQSATLKHSHPIEFLAAVLTHGKGFYSRLAYTLEARRLGIHFLSPNINLSSENFTPENQSIRVPLRIVKNLTSTTLHRYSSEIQKLKFLSINDFYSRVHPNPTEMLNLIRVGAFDGFGDSRTNQFWQLQSLSPSTSTDRSLFENQPPKFPDFSLTEPSTAQRLRDEIDLLGFTVTGHPLDQFPTIPWHTYCPIRDLHRYPGQRIVACGLIIAHRSHEQDSGGSMKFITLCDYTGIIECEIFATAYRRFGLATTQFAVVEVEAIVTPFENLLGSTLDVQRVSRPRSIAKTSASY
jgi:DNA-directed DNA polymerase III PolC